MKQTTFQRIQDLEIPLRAGFEAIAPRVWESPAGVLLRLVDDLPGFGHPDQPRQTERAASHVLHQTLDTSVVACRQEH